VLFHSQGYKDALFPVTIQAGQPRRGTIMLEDEISDQQKELNKAFRKMI
jgi:hypothetical protein